jgi:hypothetical protein
MSEHYDHYPVLLAEHELGTGSADRLKPVKHSRVTAPREIVQL